MSLISLFADVTGLTEAVRDIRSELRRIAEALERVSPPLRDEGMVTDEGRPSAAGVSPQASMAESPSEYEARTKWEAELALSLGMAPWSPQVQVLLNEMRQDLMKPKMVPNEEGTGETETALTEEEAIQAIRDAFREAIAQENTR